MQSSTVGAASLALIFLALVFISTGAVTRSRRAAELEPAVCQTVDYEEAHATCQHQHAWSHQQEAGGNRAQADCSIECSQCFGQPLHVMPHQLAVRAQASHAECTAATTTFCCTTSKQVCPPGSGSCACKLCCCCWQPIRVNTCGGHCSSCTDEGHSRADTAAKPQTANSTQMGRDYL